MHFSHIKSFSQKGILDRESWHLTKGSQLVTGSRLGFEGLGKAGFFHKVVITGGGHQGVEVADSKWINTILKNVKRSFIWHIPTLSVKTLSSVPR